MRGFVAIALFATAVGMSAQGTLDDYRRAYGLQEKLNADKVMNWARNIEWKDSSAVFTYEVMTEKGRKKVTFDAEKRSKSTEDAKQSDRQPRHQPSPFRQKQRHWMETDDEKEQRLVESPDGKWEAWIEGHNVVVNEKGKSYSNKRALTHDGTIGNYYSSQIYWSPDSKRLFVCKRQPVERRYVYYVESSPHDQLQPVLHKQEYAKPGDQLPFYTPVIVDLNGHRLEASTEAIKPQYWLSNFEWTEDGREVVFDFNERGHKHYRVMAMNAETGKLRTVVEEQSKTFVNYSRQYRQFINHKKQLIWMSERDNWNHLYLYDVEKGNVIRQITRGDWCVRQVLHVDEEKGFIIFSASGVDKDVDPYLIKYYRIGLDGKKMTCLTPAKGNHVAHFDKQWRYLVDSYSMVDAAPVAELRSAADGSLIETLERADISKLTEAGWRAPEVFKAKGRDGKTDIWGIIQRPSNYDPQKRYPVIEYIYAGPGDAYTPKSFMPYNWNMTPLAELGFIVVQLDGMGTSWRGKQFEETCYKNLKDAGFPDRICWIKAACETYPSMDSTRVGIFGASAGGQESTTAVLLHGDFYKAAYSSCGCHDNRMDKIWWNEQWMGYPVDSSYVECSNVYHASKLQRPLMLVVGELDDNVDPASTMQVADALIKANKDFELVVLPGVHHTMGERYGEHKRFDFFVKHLLGVDPPQWSEIK